MPQTNEVIYVNNKFVGMERSALHRKMKTLSIVSENKLSKSE